MNKKLFIIACTFSITAGNQLRAMEQENDPVKDFVKKHGPHALKTVYDRSPRPLQMIMEKAEEYPKTTEVVAITAAESCGFMCCPTVTWIANLLAAGWISRGAYADYCKAKAKEKEL